jgi:hypothetical protein
MQIVGYILAGLGILVSVVSKVIPLRDKILSVAKFLPAEIISKYGIYVGFALIVLGLVVLIAGGGSSHKEIPIYQGNKIVGYRRH